MLVSTILDSIQYTLADKGVYRPDSFVLQSINHGHKLVAIFSMFDERRASIAVSGSRNMTGLPDGMLVPLYVGNTDSGNRVNPVRLNEFEFYTVQWEGVTDGVDVDYYTILGLYHPSETELWCIPMASTGTTDLNILGAYVPDDMVQTESPRLSDGFQDLLYLYGVFAGFMSEPGRTKDALREYKKFIQRMNEFVASLKSRFPSGYLFSPQPMEFVYDEVTRRQQKNPLGEQPEEETNEGQ